MFAEVHYPVKLTPEELDDYLEQGWFRMDQTIFTTNFLNVNNKLYSALWLRVSLDEHFPGKTYQKLQKLNSKFRTEVKKAYLSQEKEQLFASYKEGISFDASSSLRYLLYGNTPHTYTIYNTYEINIYDEDKLIATGFFDMGATSAAGITCFYDPSYKKYSLGKYLMFLKMDYCQKQNLTYFYPGYFVPGYPLFDYKLDIGKSGLEYLNLQTRQWVPILAFSSPTTPIQQMSQQLHALQSLLAQSAIDGKVLQYKFFDANLYPDFAELKLFDFPLFLDCFDLTDPSVLPVIIYDVRDQHYHWLHCRLVGKNSIPDNIPELYSSHLLRIEGEIYATDSIQEMAKLLAGDSIQISRVTKGKNLSTSLP